MPTQRKLVIIVVVVVVAMLEAVCSPVINMHAKTIAVEFQFKPAANQLLLLAVHQLQFHVVNQLQCPVVAPHK